MLTAFGKELRKLRIMAGELIRDMAARLDVTASYLSGVDAETGMDFRVTRAVQMIQ